MGAKVFGTEVHSDIDLLWILNDACNTGLIVANGDSSYRMHRVWQQVIRDLLQDDDKLKTTAELLIKIASDALPRLEVSNTAFLIKRDEWDDWLALQRVAKCVFHLFKRILVQRSIMRKFNATVWHASNAFWCRVL